MRAAEEGWTRRRRRYIAQALTDVDLFSSYGLTQKATHLLENVLQRAPRHTPTLERLLDLVSRRGQRAPNRRAGRAARTDPSRAPGHGQYRTLRRAAAEIPETGGNRRRKICQSRHRRRHRRPRRQRRWRLRSRRAGDHRTDVPVTRRKRPGIRNSDGDRSSQSRSLQRFPRAVVAPPEALPFPSSRSLWLPSAASEEVDLSDEWEAMVQEVAEPAAAAPAPEEVAPAPEPVPVGSGSGRRADRDRSSVR